MKNQNFKFESDRTININHRLAMKKMAESKIKDSKYRAKLAKLCDGIYYKSISRYGLDDEIEDLIGYIDDYGNIKKGIMLKHLLDGVPFVIRKKGKPDKLVYVCIFNEVQTWLEGSCFNFFETTSGADHFFITSPTLGNIEVIFPVL